MAGVLNCLGVKLLRDFICEVVIFIGSQMMMEMELLSTWFSCLIRGLRMDFDFWKNRRSITINLSF